MGTLSRRELLAAAAAAPSLKPSAAASNDKRFTVCAFSKHFQWTDVKGAAETMKDLGYEGVDLTVRPAGHVLPERAKDDLPKAAEVISKAGLKLAMITSDIVDTKTPHAESVLNTLAVIAGSPLSVGWLPVRSQAKHSRSVDGVQGAGQGLGSDEQAVRRYRDVSHPLRCNASWPSFWDLYLLLKDFDTDAVSANYDIGHATVEGGFGGWIHSSRLLLPYMRGVAVKDFKWIQNEKGAWVPGWCALGDGMVNFKQFLPMLKEAGFSGPLQLHMEYPELGSAANGKTESSVPKDKLLAMMRRDITRLKALLRDAGLA